jgi:GNAT superfamily N-acetyltransferase
MALGGEPQRRDVSLGIDHLGMLPRRCHDRSMRMTDADPDETAALLRLWVEGWAASRGVPPPVAHGDGWRVEVGLPRQKRRHVFPRISQALHALGETIDEPWSYLKACATADELRAALPPRWTVETQTCFMRFDGASPPGPALPDGYTLDVAAKDRVAVARVVAADGTQAAAGHLTIVEDAAIFDRISTDAAHRRRGLGRVVMSALDAAARRRGARRGLLAATADGHALYRTLGWRVQSPYASAMIVGE